MSEYPEILQYVKDSIKSQALNESVPNDIAERLSYAVAENLRKDWGGMQVYICKGNELSKRDAEIWATFTGNNHHELCRKFEITMQRVYKIIAVQRRLEEQDKQADVFG